MPQRHRPKNLQGSVKKIAGLSAKHVTKVSTVTVSLKRPIKAIQLNDTHII
jgi:hypothetical protein